MARINDLAQELEKAENATPQPAIGPLIPTTTAKNTGMGNEEIAVRNELELVNQELKTLNDYHVHSNPGQAKPKKEKLEVERKINLEKLSAIQEKRKKARKAESTMLGNLKKKIGLGIDKQLRAGKKLRGNEMFYEFPLDKFDDNLVDAMVEALPDSIRIINEQKENIRKLAKFALQQIRFVDTGGKETMCGGMRGRLKAPAFGQGVCESRDA
ncbi:MAG: hypothetical protein LBI81_03265 [Puniceicoccales bacterium]|nr:hypothetical protein [Puniceicoccales bacterium]